MGTKVVLTTDNGTILSQQRYLPFGQVRTDAFTPGNISQTDFGYTGQRTETAGLGLMDYHARDYDSYLMRWVQPDSIVPNVSSPQSWNRYSYVNNSPMDNNDPTGHVCLDRAEAHGRPYAACPDDSGGGYRPPTPDRHIKPVIPDAPACRLTACIQESPSNICPLGATCYMQGKPDLWHDPAFWNNVAVTTQDMATMASSTGAVVEITSTISGCVVGSEVGVLPGCAAGYEAGRIFHLGVTNPFETTLSGISLYATIRYDSLTGSTRIVGNDPRTWVIGEATKTSTATFVSGLLITEPIIDASIDIYASGYNHGAFCGISTILDCLP